MFSLEYNAVIKQGKDGAADRIFTLDEASYVDPDDGFAYTADPYAVLVADTGAYYTTSGAEPLSSDNLPDIKFTNPIDLATDNAQMVVTGQVLYIGEKQYVLFDPLAQDFVTNLIEI